MPLTYDQLADLASKIAAFTLAARHESPEPSREAVSKRTAEILGIESADEPITREQAAVFARASEMVTQYQSLMQDYLETR